YWLPLHPHAQIYVASFVRKLVADLQADIATSDELDQKDRRRLAVTTLHQLARSLLERSLGTAEQRMRRHIRVIAPPWDVMVFEDVLQFESDVDLDTVR